MADALKVAAKNYKLVLENDRVRILEYRGSPGDKTELHSHPDLVAVALGGAKVQFSFPSGETADAELKDGEAGFFPATEHSTTNIGTTVARIILVELK